MTTAIELARFILSLQSEDAGDLISNMKLQKLVYYTQGLHLALYDQPLFLDEVEAWTHGPVVPAVYEEFKKFGNSSIPTPHSTAPLSDTEAKLIEEVYEEFGQYSAWKLRNMTHAEQPYLEAQKSSSRVISKQSMRNFFKNYLTMEKA